MASEPREEAGRLTEADHWDAFWERTRLPALFGRDGRNLSSEIFCDVLERHLPREAGLTALEIGGAPGQYLAYVHRTFGYRVACLDYSAAGCARTRDNFALLSVPGDVFEGDFFSDSVALPRFDIVYSLGFIEHFDDTADVVGRHARLVKPGGWLMLGAPNLLGINGWFRRRLAPRSFAMHNLAVMDLRRWPAFEEPLGLVPVFRDYVGGFDPSRITKCEQRGWRMAAVWRLARTLDKLFRKRGRLLHRYNARWLSGYMLGIYRVPAAPGGVS